MVSNKINYNRAREIRYEIAPQMKEYDKISPEWVPYLMFFHAPNYSSRVLNTDSRGFRFSYDGEKRIGGFESLTEETKCLFVGGSTAFGIGATSDRNTIPSILNSKTKNTWLNFGARAFSSTQELLLFLFYYKKVSKIKKVIIFSGLNNLAIHYLSGQYPKDLGQFFFYNKYKEAMEEADKTRKRKAVEAVLKLAVPRNFLKKKKINTSKIRNSILEILDRDISTWSLFAGSLGIELHYVLQPVASWIDKKPSTEEKLLFDALDNFPQNVWKVINKMIGREQYDWLFAGIRHICESNKVHFFDMNEAVSRKNLHDEWMYVDRAHFTDLGNAIVADILIEEVL